MTLIRLIIYTTYSRNRKQALQCIRNTIEATEIVIIEKNTLCVQSFANFSESSFLLKLEERKETDRCQNSISRDTFNRFVLNVVRDQNPSSESISRSEEIINLQVYIH